MATHLTKVAFGVTGLDHLVERLADRARGGEPVFLTTRYLPKRHAEIAGQGSLFWILKHQLIGRSSILGFGDAEGGRTSILIDPRVILVQQRPKRAHQGWRYLEGGDAPPDLGGGGDDIAEMPAEMVGDLAAIGLI